MIWENSSGEIEEAVLRPGVGYTCVSRQKHRLIGLTDCSIVEVFTPARGTTCRLEDDFERPDETEAGADPVTRFLLQLILDPMMQGWHPGPRRTLGFLGLIDGECPVQVDPGTPAAIPDFVLDATVYVDSECVDRTPHAYGLGVAGEIGADVTPTSPRTRVLPVPEPAGGVHAQVNQARAGGRRCWVRYEDSAQGDPTAPGAASQRFVIRETIVVDTDRIEGGAIRNGRKFTLQNPAQAGPRAPAENCLPRLSPRSCLRH